MKQIKSSCCATDKQMMQWFGAGVASPPAPGAVKQDIAQFKFNDYFCSTS